MLRLHRDPHPLTPANSTALMQLLAGDAVAGVQLGAQISRWNYWGRGDVVACGTPPTPRRGLGYRLTYPLRPAPLQPQ